MSFKYSNKSKANLETAHPDLQHLFNDVIKYIDCKILYGHRSPEEQFKLYLIGRELVGHTWVKSHIGNVVTNCDGYKVLSNHNRSPSLAVDVAPYPIDWKDIPRFIHFGGVVQGIAWDMGINIIWGGDWDSDHDHKDQTFMDYPHYELSDK